MYRSAFVTGATGFIGTNLVRELLTNNWRVIGLARKKSYDYLSHDNLKIIEGDTLDKECLLEAVSGIDILFHCAAFISFSPRDFKKSYEVNVLGTRNVLEAGLYNKVKKIVHLSAASVLGYTKTPGEIIDENREFNISRENSYIYTKKLAEDLVMDYIDRGMDVSIADISTVYGSGDRKMNSGTIIRSIYKNEVRFAPPGGTSYVSVDDLIRGLIMLSEKGKRGERYIFCTENLRYLELFNRIAKTLKREPIKYILPRWTYLPILGASILRDFFCRGSGNKINVLTSQIIKETYFYKYYSSRKARQELGWQPKISLEEAVEEALGFYLKEGLI